MSLVLKFRNGISLNYIPYNEFSLEFLIFVVGSGFEPLKAKPADLQSAPIGHSGNPPFST